MGRVIDADELKEMIKDPPLHTSLGGMTINDVLTIIDEQPTVDFKHGVWEISIVEADSEFTENLEVAHCSECGYHNTEKGVRSPYCPRCGARMDGKNIEIKGFCMDDFADSINRTNDMLKKEK